MAKMTFFAFANQNYKGTSDDEEMDGWSDCRTRDRCWV